jgi:tetraacyldisaccharide 4'-kinase
MALAVIEAYRLADGRRRPLSEFAAEAPVHAVAGIGHPSRFFRMLRDAGLSVEEHAFPDHHPYRPGDLDFPDRRPVLMTEKDGVKCRRFADARMWAVAVEARLAPAVADALLSRLERDKRGQKTA